MASTSATRKGTLLDQITSVQIGTGGVTEKRFCFNSTTGLVASTLGGLVHGVAVYTEVAGNEGSYYSGGIVEVESGAAFAKGDLIMSDATGRAVTRTTTLFVAGVAKYAATGAGQFIEIELTEAIAV